MVILVSACLLGKNCRYKGDNAKDEKVIKFVEGHKVIPVCPESMGGLKIPRAPSEISGGKVIDKNGNEVTENLKNGALATLITARQNEVDLCILKSKSPSCGKGKIYDGTFSGVLTDGNGITADLLIKNGFKVITENEL